MRLGHSLSRLVCLQKLKLAHAGLSTVALASLSRLTRLQLYGCRWRPTASHFQESSEDSESEADAVSDAADLLAAIGGMCQLQHLTVDGYNECLPYTGRYVDCAALTASSQLTHLEIRGWWEQPLPEIAVQHVFPAGRQLPQLQQLVLS